MCFAVASLAQPLGPVLNLSTGEIVGFAIQEGKDIVILNPKSGVSTIISPEPNRPSTPNVLILVAPAHRAQEPKTPTPDPIPNPQEK
jgi:hypothetical protein